MAMTEVQKPVLPVDLKVSGAQVRNAMVLEDVFQVPLERCTQCGVTPAFVRYDEFILYDPVCRHGEPTSVRTVSWDEVAEWINSFRKKQQRKQLLSAFGFHCED